MLEKLRERCTEESGFTLVELLVVMLILGILATIAIPAFLSQRDKAYDSDAMANARTVQTALESYGSDNAGDYTNAGITSTAAGNLRSIEGMIGNFVPAGSDLGGSVALSGLGDGTYTTTAAADSGNTFSVERAATGSLTNPCATEGDGGCPTGGWGWSSNSVSGSG